MGNFLPCCWLLLICTVALAQPDPPRRLATGNLSVDEIMRSPIGAHPDPNFGSHPPAVESLRQLVAQGLAGYEDYMAWGMIEPREGVFDFAHHDAVQRNLAVAGLPYTPYIWCHVPPTWLRDDPRASLMRCNAHREATYMLSIFDPRTLDWYEHFYRALHEHFGERISEVYACILGPYGEGNYPLPYSDFVVNLGHKHEGYWCGDEHALPAFRAAMRAKYGEIAQLNAAWGTTHADFDAIEFPSEIVAEKLPSFIDRPSHDRRRWLDFITWYHQALIDFADGSIERVIKIFGRERVATKPGGNAGWMNPLSWGTHAPGYAKIAGLRGIAVQTADAHGAYWADKWSSTAYRHYGVPFRTEGAGAMDRRTFIRRIFSDASCGAEGLFTYEIDKHVPDAQRWLHLYEGQPGITDVALLAPTTDYYLAADVMPIIQTGMKLRDVLDYDVLDELLVRDDALAKYRVVVSIDARIVERDVIDRLAAWVESGGTLIVSSPHAMTDVEGRTDHPLNESATLARGQILRVSGDYEALAAALIDHTRPLDAAADNIWLTEFPASLLLLNLTDSPVQKSVTWRGREHTIALPPHELVEVRP